MEAPRRQLLLVVDDESRSTRMLARMLREDGFDVEIAFDGAAAISRLSRAPVPDALVTDVRMPHVDGVSVAKYARSRRNDIPVVFVTGYPQLVQGRGDDLPASVVVTKPVDYGALSRQLGALLGRGEGAVGGLVATSLGADAISVEHEQLHVLSSQIAAAASAAELRELLGKLSAYLERHFEREQGRDGFFQELLKLAPRFETKVERLTREHGSLLGELEALRQALAERGMEAAPKMVSLLENLEQHESEERELLQVAYDADLGGSGD